MLKFTSFKTFKIKNKQDAGAFRFDGKKITVVIDAGHGGKDGGARSTDGILEKDITFSIANKIKTLNENPNVEILLTRESDVYKSPFDKSEFARKNNADILISIHCDAEGNNIKIKQSGLTVWIPQNDNPYLKESKVLASSALASFKQEYGLPVIDGLNQRNLALFI